MIALGRAFWSAVVTAHLFVAAVALWLLPGGFPSAHPKFWSNRVLPIAMFLLAASCTWVRAKNREALFRALLLAFPALWFSVAVTSRIVFPITARVLWLLPVIVALVMIAPFVRALRTKAGMPIKLSSAAIGFGCVVGVALVLAQRGEDPATQPLNLPIESSDPSVASRSSFNVIRLAPELRVQPNGGVVYVDAGNLHLDIEPLLSFISRSPDRCWVLLARHDARVGPRRSISSVEQSPDSARVVYIDDDRSVLSVTNTGEIEAISSLPQPVYSHLNSYCTISVIGQRKLEIEFSPCAGRRFEVKYFDYPFGRPAQLAYLDAAGNFNVVEAQNAEKGPFRTLASGKHSRGEPLTLTFYDGGAPRCSVTLEDWSAQLSTALSPTAGWGLPVNAITFSLARDDPKSPALITFELAGTGVGRGYDSVGHAAGVYRNRVRVAVH